MREPVHTIDDYYDSPRQGIADFDGEPHYYECEFDKEADEYSDVFRLTPIADSIFKLAIEKWQIWCCWERAFHAGEVTLDTHPALAEERSRYEELKKIVDQQIASGRPNSVRARGNFVRGVAKSFEVGWGGAAKSFEVGWGGAAKSFEVEWVRLGR